MLIILAVKKLISEEATILSGEAEQDIFFSVHHIFLERGIWAIPPSIQSYNLLEEFAYILK